MKAKVRFSLFALVTAAAVASTAYGAGATRVAGAIWVDDVLYDTVATPTSFVAPPEHSTDLIYSFMMSGLGGQRSIADAAPGDPDFNGGRWNVQMVVFTEDGLDALDMDHDDIIDFELTSDADVLAAESLGYLEISPANFYFECPLLPRRGEH